MKYHRKFVLKISNVSLDCYVKEIYKNAIGYYYVITYNVKSAKTWRYKKTCENNMIILQTKLNPTKNELKKYTFEIIEITDNQTLRGIKLNKIKRNEI